MVGYATDRGVSRILKMPLTHFSENQPDRVLTIRCWYEALPSCNVSPLFKATEIILNSVSPFFTRNIRALMLLGAHTHVLPLCVLQTKCTVDVALTRKWLWTNLWKFNYERTKRLLPKEYWDLPLKFLPKKLEKKLPCHHFHYSGRLE